MFIFPFIVNSYQQIFPSHFSNEKGHKIINAMNIVKVGGVSLVFILLSSRCQILLTELNILPLYHLGFNQ
jgi:hypothetical protein